MENAERVVERVVGQHHHRPDRLLQILIETQDALGYLPPACLTGIARLLRLSRARVEGVAGFYSFLRLQPAGRYRFLFSDNITDRTQGGPELMRRLCAELRVEPGRPDPQGLVSIDTTS